jgi:hypothetical protein
MCAIESELGRVFVEGFSGITSALKPKERLWSCAYTGIALDFCKDLSFRNAANKINKILHRPAEHAMKMRTLADCIGSYGRCIGERLKSDVGDILEENRFDPETAKPKENTVPRSISEPKPSGTKEERAVLEKEARKKVAEINKLRELSREQIKNEKLVDDVELSAADCCYISIDGVGVKHQKETRGGDGVKNGKYVENTVIHVQADGASYWLTAVGMDDAFKLLMAFLLSNGVMENRKLVFFADGAMNVKSRIEDYFSFCPHSIILDWYHLKKKCKELISSSFFGNKEQKKEITQNLLRILWVGNVAEAVKYLTEIDKKLVKSAKWLGELTGYLERKEPQAACYALRQGLELRLSSNRVEKANDMLVAQRQKHNGMSWSFKGSGALASITMLLLNGELDRWLYNHTLSFAMKVPAAVAA